MKSLKIRSTLLLFLCAAIWGSAFVAQSEATQYISTFTFNGLRSVLACIVLIPTILIMDRIRKKSEQTTTAHSATERSMPAQTLQKSARQRIFPKPSENKLLWIGGISCGVILTIASNLQQMGIETTTVGKSGFITAFYIVLVPVFAIFLKKKAGWNVWVSVALAVLGLYFLCMKESVSGLTKGDYLLLLCAVGFTCHILVVDHFSPKVDGVRMSLIQFLTCAIINIIGMLIFEKPDFSVILQAWLPIFYAGALSSGAGYTLQIVGQKGLQPAVASLIMSMESVFSVLAGWVLLGQALSAREGFGCVLMFAGIVLAQIPIRQLRIFHTKNT